MGMRCFLLVITFILASGGVSAQGDIVGYDFSAKGRHQSKLGRMLREVSGIAFNARGQLLAHDDEKGVVYRVDAMTGSILSRFRLGRTTVTEDFEDIAVAGDTIVLATSDGRLFLFHEGRDGERVEYRVLVTPLTRTNDVEGLCLDPVTGTLLLACKESPGRGYSGKKAVYSYSLSERRMETKPRFLLDENTLLKKAAGRNFKPSAVAWHPLRKTFFLLASEGRSIVEIDARGKILAQHELEKKLHPQPEGLAFHANGDMMIADEGKKDGLLTRYFYRGKH